MPKSAFKSTTRRSTTSSNRSHSTTTASTNSSLRRSRSFSSISQSNLNSNSGTGNGNGPPPPSSAACSARDLSDFSRTRDNPLFGCSPSSSSSSTSLDVDARRGRLPVENVTSTRNFSRPAESRRARSVSRVRSEGGVGRGYLRSTSSSRNKEISSSSGNSSDFNVNDTWRQNSKHLSRDAGETSSCCAFGHNWDDGVSACSFSDSEEATIRDFCEQMQSELLGDDEEGGTADDTAQSEVWPNVSEIKNDLENAHERARKLRADLAVEEQRKQELSRMLKEMLPTRKHSESQKTRSRRKANIERNHVSRHLAEQARNYFEECVSISTFDSSDISSFEDPALVCTDAASQLNSSGYHPISDLSASGCLNDHFQHQQDCENQTQCSLSFRGSDIGVISNCSYGTVLMNESSDHEGLRSFTKPCCGFLQYPSVSKSIETDALDIRYYTKMFEKQTRKAVDRSKVRYNPDDYKNHTSVERLLLDRLTYKSRIEAGGLLICDIRTFL